MGKTNKDLRVGWGGVGLGKKINSKFWDYGRYK